MCEGEGSEFALPDHSIGALVWREWAGETERRACERGRLSVTGEEFAECTSPEELEDNVWVWKRERERERNKFTSCTCINKNWYFETQTLELSFSILTAKLCGVNLEIVDCMTRRASKVEEKGSSLETSIALVIPSRIPGNSDTWANDSCNY